MKQCVAFPSWDLESKGPRAFSDMGNMLNVLKWLRGKPDEELVDKISLYIDGLESELHFYLHKDFYRDILDKLVSLEGIPFDKNPSKEHLLELLEELNEGRHERIKKFVAYMTEQEDEIRGIATYLYIKKRWTE